MTGYGLALSVLSQGGCGNSSSNGSDRTSRNKQPAPSDLDAQQSSDQQTSQQGGNQQLLHPQQQQRDLLKLLPLLFGALRELQLLAQQLQPVMKHVGNPLRPGHSAYDDCQQYATAAMTSICCGLVDVVLSQHEPQQLMLSLTVLDSCCGQLEEAMRGYGLLGKADSFEFVEQLNKLLVWFVSSPAAGQLSSGASFTVTVPGVCGLLLTYFKCQAAWLHTMRSKDSSRAYCNITDHRVTSGIRWLLKTASTGIRLAGIATAAAVESRATRALPDAAAAGLILAGRSMYMAGDLIIKGKHIMLPHLYTASGLPVWQSVPWELSGCGVFVEDLEVLLPQLKLPGASAAARAAAADLQEQYQQFKQSLLKLRTTTPQTGTVLGLISDVDTKVPEQLMSFGSALCTQLPMPWCCNNSECLNLSCESEQKLVQGKACVGCRPRRAKYCGPECQKQHWSQHKPVCERLR